MLVRVPCVIWVISDCDSCCNIYEVDKDVLFFRCRIQVSACLCGFSFLNNQDAKSFYFIICIYVSIFCFCHFFLREFQLMASAPDDSSLSLDQDTNQFLV